MPIDFAGKIPHIESESILILDHTLEKGKGFQPHQHHATDTHTAGHLESVLEVFLRSMIGRSWQSSRFDLAIIIHQVPIIDTSTAQTKLATHV